MSPQLVQVQVLIELALGVAPDWRRLQAQVQAQVQVLGWVQVPGVCGVRKAVVRRQPHW